MARALSLAARLNRPERVPMPSNALIATILSYGAIPVIFYFLLFRPQQKQRKEHEAMLRTLRKGDDIVTAGGIVGEVVFLAQPSQDGAPNASMEDRVTIKSGDTRLIVERGRIAKVTRKTSPIEVKG
jgi:preprotein translocase subunit YajC